MAQSPTPQGCFTTRRTFTKTVIKNSKDDDSFLKLLSSILAASEGHPTRDELNALGLAFYIRAARAMDDAHVFPDGLKDERARLLSELTNLSEMISEYQVDEVTELYRHQGDYEAWEKYLIEKIRKNNKT